MTASVGIVGTGPAADAVEAALVDLDVATSRIDPDAVTSMDLSVVTGPCGAPPFDRVHRTARRSWLAVELGGVGGHAIEQVDAAISVLDPGGGCYDCLRVRVQSNLEEPDEDEPRTTKRDARLAGAIAGWRAAAFVSGGDVAGRVVELPYLERRLLPVPGCSCSGQRSRALDRTHADVPIEEVAGMVEGGVDDRLGIVHEVGEIHSFPAPYYLAVLCDTTTFSDAEAGHQAAGVAADWTPAFVKAVGEALERYAAGVYRGSSFDSAPASERADAIAPATFVLPPGYDDPDPNESIAWVHGESLHDGRDVSLPAEFVVFPPPDRRHKPSITTGLGLGSSGVGALLSGLYEVVERDATMLAWYSTFEPLGLSVDDPGFDELARRAGAEGLTVTPMLVTQDVDVPVVSVAVHHGGEWPRFAIGSGADLDPTKAARSALAEALQNWMELRSMGPEQAAQDPSEIASYADLPSAAASLIAVEGTVDADALGSADPLAGTEELEAVLDRLASVGLDAFASRLTTRDVEALGFEVVRVLVPDAQPLFAGGPFFGERARAVPRELGFEPRLDRPHHPYP